MHICMYKREKKTGLRKEENGEEMFKLSVKVNNGIMHKKSTLPSFYQPKQ